MARASPGLSSAKPCTPWVAILWQQQTCARHPAGSLLTLKRWVGVLGGMEGQQRETRRVLECH